MKIQLFTGVVKRLSLKLACELPLPLLMKLSDGKLSRDEIKDLAALAASVVSEEIMKIAEEAKAKRK